MQTLRDKATDVVRRLREAGFEAYFAGGCVRDQLLGREPLDYDVATSAPPARIQELFPQTVPVGIQFGVILVLLDGAPIEVATRPSAPRPGPAWPMPSSVSWASGP